MTGNELYEQALALVPAHAGEDDGMRRYVVGWLNLAMNETLHAENSLRQRRGEPVLDSAPLLRTMEDTVPYSPELVRYAFLYFVASLLCKDDDDNYWAQDYRTRYVVAVSEALRLRPGHVADVWSGDSDGKEHTHGI